MKTPRGTAETTGFRSLACGLLLVGAACGGASTAPSPPVAAAPPTPVALSPCTVAAPPLSGWTWNRANFPGHILSLAIDEQDGRTWVASSESPNQVWVTNDAGASWRPVLEGLTDFGALQTSPTALYAPVARASSGLNVSRDHGRSWFLTLRPSGDASYIETVLSSRVRPGLLLAGAERLAPGNLRPSSIYRSLDDGATWTEAAFDDRLRYLSAPRFAEDGTGVILAASDFATPGVYVRSTDAGETWQSVGGPLQNVWSRDLRGDTVRHRIFAVGNGFVSVTEDGGRSWSRALGGMTSPDGLVVDERSGGVFATQGRPARGLHYLPDGASSFRAVSLEGIEDLSALALDRCGSVLLAGTFGYVYSSPIPRNP